MKKIKFILLFLIIFIVSNNIIDLYAKDYAPEDLQFPFLKLGISVPLNINIQNGYLYNFINDCYSCKPIKFNNVTFTSGISLSADYMIGNTIFKPILDSISLGLYSSISYIPIEFTGNSNENSRMVYLNNNIINLLEKNNIIFSADYLSFGFGLLVGSAINFDNFNSNQKNDFKFYFSIVPSIKFLVTKKVSQYMSIQSPEEFYYSNNKKEISYNNGNFNTYRNILFAIDLKFTSEYYIKDFIQDIFKNGVIIFGDLGFQINNTSIFSESTVINYPITINLGIKTIIK